MTSSLQDLEQAIEYSFKESALLTQALTHASVVFDHRNNERLEFLGDRVLGLVIAQALYQQFPQASEGELASRQSHLVSRDVLTKVGEDLNLKKFMRIAKGNRRKGFFNNKSMVADACEALIAALFLDGGLPAAQAFILKYWDLELQAAGSLKRDAKSLVQEWVQGRGKPAPSYQLIQRTGPDHEPLFQIGVQIEGFEQFLGEGPSKRAAEQQAAQKILQQIREIYG